MKKHGRLPRPFGAVHGAGVGVQRVVTASSVRKEAQPRSGGCLPLLRHGYDGFASSFHLTHDRIRVGVGPRARWQEGSGHRLSPEVVRSQMVYKI